MMSTPGLLSAFRRTALILALVTGTMPAFAQESANQSATRIASNQAGGEVVLIPSRVIYPGETINLAALKQVTLIVGKHKPEAVATRAEELDGKVAKRTLLPGRYIPSTAIREAWLVEQGASVQIFFIAGGLTISATAV
ncbi:flagellar basal body P-ring formation chaperone FlgA, partial [Mesorhizobium sp.]